MISYCTIYAIIIYLTTVLSFHRDNYKWNKNNLKIRSSLLYFYKPYNKLDQSRVLRLNYASNDVKAIPYINLTVGIPKEKNYGEKRVSQTPISVAFLKEKGFNVVVEKGAGSHAGFNDSQYESCGATLVNRHTVWDADIVLKVQPPSNDEARLLGNRTLISFMHHAVHKDTISILANQNSTVMSMNMLPSQYRGLSFDAITSQARICGYQAFTESFFEISKETNVSAKNSKVLIIGGGEAGISALKEAKKKGMIVSLYDRNLVNQKKVELAGGYFVKPAVLKKNETFEDAERELLSSVLAKFDLVISTMVMGDQTTSPTLVTSAMLQTMRKGSVVFDMAASLRGGNVQQSRPNEVVVTSNGVKVIGFTDLPSRAAGLASAAYANNIADFLLSVGHNSRMDRRNVFYPTTADPVVKAMLMVNQGQVVGNNIIDKTEKIDIPDKQATKNSADLKSVLNIIAENKKIISNNTLTTEKPKIQVVQSVEKPKVIVAPINEKPKPLTIPIVEKPQVEVPKQNVVIKPVETLKPTTSLLITNQTTVTSVSPKINISIANNSVLNKTVVEISPLINTTIEKSLPLITITNNSNKIILSEIKNETIKDSIVPLPTREPEAPYNANNTLKNLVFASFLSSLAFTAISSNTPPDIKKEIKNEVQIVMSDINNEFNSEVETIMAESTEFKDVISKFDINDLKKYESYLPLLVSTAAISPFLFSFNSNNTKISTGSIKTSSTINEKSIENVKSSSSVKNIYQNLDKNRVNLIVPKKSVKTEITIDNKNNNTISNPFSRVFSSIRKRIPSVPNLGLQRPRLSPIISRVGGSLISLRTSISRLFFIDETDETVKSSSSPKVKVGEKVNQLTANKKDNNSKIKNIEKTSNESIKIPFINGLFNNKNKTSDITKDVKNSQQQSIKTNLKQQNKVIRNITEDNNIYLKTFNNVDNVVSKSFGTKNIILSFVTFSVVSLLSSMALFNYPTIESVSNIATKVSIINPVETPKPIEVQKVVEKEPERLNLLSSVFATISIVPALIGYLFSRVFEFIFKFLFVR